MRRGGVRGGWERWVSPWATATKVGVVLIGPAAVCAWLGAADVRSALTFGGRLEGALGLLAAVILVAGAGSALVFQAGSLHAGSVALAASIVAALVGLLGLILALEGDALPVPTILSLAILLAAAWAVLRVVRAGVVVSYPKSLAAAVVIPGLFAAANFVYTDIYVPAAQPREVELTMTVGQAAVSPHGRIATVPLTIDFKNLSTHKLYVLGTSYSAVGRLVRPADLPLSAPNIRPAGPSQESYARNVEVLSFDLLQAGQFAPPGSSIEAGASKTFTEILDVDVPTQYDEIDAEATILLLRADQATLTSNSARNQCRSWDATGDRCVAPGWVAVRGVPFVRFQAPLTEGTRVRQVTRKRRYVTTWWVLASPTIDNPSGPYLQGTIAVGGRESVQPTPGYYNHVSSDYGFQLNSTGEVARSLTELGLPTSG